MNNWRNSQYPVRWIWGILFIKKEPNFGGLTLQFIINILFIGFRKVDLIHRNHPSSILHFPDGNFLIHSNPKKR
jgi:hypothetical protein